MQETAMPLFSEDHYQSTDGIGHLLTRTRNMLTKSFDAALDQYDITHAQGSILWMLSVGKFSTASDLSRELYIDAASMTRMIDRLEKRKLLLRMPRGEDRRVIILRLTPSGRILAEKLPAIHAAVMNHNFDGFQAEEIEQLGALLNKFLGNHLGTNPQSKL